MNESVSFLPEKLCLCSKIEVGLLLLHFITVDTPVQIVDTPKNLVDFMGKTL